MNVLLYSGYLTNIPMALEEAACGRSKYMDNLLENYLSNYETNACDSSGSDSTRNME